MELTRDGLAKRLKETRANIIFIKADGTQRIMHCTLMKKFLPEQIDVEEYISDKSKSQEALAVWDLEKQDWRSFRLDRIEEIIWA